MNKKTSKQIENYKCLNKKYGFALTPLSGKAAKEPEWQNTAVDDFNPSDFKNKNAGVVCGPSSGVIVLDQDDLYAFDIIVKENKLDIPDTFTVRTGSGKFHLYYQYPTKKGKEYKCRGLKHPVFKSHTILDIKAMGGQVVAPGSIHPDTGKTYKISKDIPIAPAPRWLREYSLNKKEIHTDILFNHPPTEEYKKIISGYEKLSAKVKKLILSGKEKGERSEAIFKVIIGLLKVNFSDKAIFYIFNYYPIGQKYRDDKKKYAKWLQGEIDRAKKKVKKKGQKKSPPVIDEKKAKAIASSLIKRQQTTKFNTSALPDLLRNYIDHLCTTTDADPIMITMAVLGEVSAFMKNKIYIDEEDYYQKLYPNLWMLSISESGSFKSTALKKGAKLALQKSKMVTEQIDQLKKDLCLLKKNAKKEDKDKIEKTELMIKEYETSDVVLPDRTTPESLFEHLSDGNGGVLLISEFGPWLESMNKKYNIGLKGLLTDLYDVPSQYSIKTKSGGHLKIKEPYISIVGVSTLPWVESNMNLEDVAVGFFARFLLFYPPPEDHIPEALPTIKKDNPYESDLQDLLNSIPSDRAYKLSKKTTLLFKKLHKELYKTDKKDKKNQAILSPFIKRWSPYLLKLSMIMQYCKNPKSKIITTFAMRSAQSVLDYAIQSTKILFQNELGQSLHQQKGAKVLKYIASQGGKVTRKKLLSSHTLEGGGKDYDYVIDSLVEMEKIEVDNSNDKKPSWLYVLI